MEEKVSLVFRHSKRKENPIKSGIKEVRNFLYNNDSKTILGKSPENLGKTLLFYFCFYFCLFAFFAVILAFTLFVVIDANEPFRTQMNSVMKENPGLAFRPQPNVESTLIRFIQGSRSSYKFYMDQLQAFLNMYEFGGEDGEDLGVCDNYDVHGIPAPRTGEDRNKVCSINVGELVQETSCIEKQDYGFDEGQPCIVLKMNNVYDWIPIGYNNSEVPEDLKKSGVYKEGHISVTCEGETPIDKEHMGTLEYIPKHGIPFYFFPYRNQEGSRSPFVFVRFVNATNGVLLNIWCKAWAKNLHHHREDVAASVHFELLID